MPNFCQLDTHFYKLFSISFRLRPFRMMSWPNAYPFVSAGTYLNLTNKGTKQLLKQDFNMLPRGLSIRPFWLFLTPPPLCPMPALFYTYISIIIFSSIFDPSPFKKCWRILCMTPASTLTFINVSIYFQATIRCSPRPRRTLFKWRKFAAWKMSNSAQTEMWGFFW